MACGAFDEGQGAMGETSRSSEYVGILKAGDSVAERRRELRQAPDYDHVSAEAVIHTERGEDIVGVLMDYTNWGVGIAISTHEPVAVGDHVNVETETGSEPGVVRHISRSEVVHVGIQFSG